MLDHKREEVYRHSRADTYGTMAFPLFMALFFYLIFAVAEQSAAVVRLAQLIFFGGALIVLAVFLVKASERTVISGDVVELRVAGFVWRRFSVLDITGYRRCKRYYTRKYHLPLWLYQNEKCTGDIGDFPGMDRVSELLRERRCPPHFPGRTADGRFRVGVLMLVKDGCLHYGGLRVPLSEVSIPNGVLRAPNGRRLGWVSYMTTNAVLLAWLLVQEHKNLAGTMLGKTLL